MNGTEPKEELSLKQQAVLEKRRKLDAFIRGDVEEKGEAQKAKSKEKREIDVMEAAVERKQKEVVVPPKPKTAWQQEVEDLELEGLAAVGRNPEEVVIGEKRTDEEVGK